MVFYTVYTELRFGGESLFVNMLQMYRGMRLFEMEVGSAVVQETRDGSGDCRTIFMSSMDGYLGIGSYVTVIYYLLLD